MDKRKYAVALVGPQPPAYYGMSTTNLAVAEELKRKGAAVYIFDTGIKSLDRWVLTRLRRAFVVLFQGLRLLFTPGLHGRPLYLSVSGGLGQLYELVFVAIGRSRKMDIFARHCSFAYLNEQTFLMRLFVYLAGRNALHITQCDGMSRGLQIHYGATCCVSISNAVLYDPAGVTQVARLKLDHLGFISNISEEKGVVEFLDVVEKLELNNSGIKAFLAGPFENRLIQKYVEERLKNLRSVTYLGPVYGDEKSEFYDNIDVLLFPTKYKDETEGKITHEAMCRGVPVVAFGRGCLPELIDDKCGAIFPENSDFVSLAVKKLELWRVDKDRFHAASIEAIKRFNNLRGESMNRWNQLNATIVGV
ncbi:glycosyltransferase family 4 protein [Algiphilus sp.]|uniref:glycosyltransferase family 4 protein n=1 Tax=Algiphilus sp. TaxID=1872431 RepID=UPI003C7B03FF